MDVDDFADTFVTDPAHREAIKERDRVAKERDRLKRELQQVREALRGSYHSWQTLQGYVREAETRYHEAWNRFTAANNQVSAEAARSLAGDQ